MEAIDSNERGLQAARSKCCGSRRCARSPPTRCARSPRRSASSACRGAWACAPATPRRPTARARTGAALDAMVTTPESLSLLLSRADQARTFGALHARHRRRVARAHRQQARRAGRARARAAARARAGASRLGPVGDARQSRRSARRAAAADAAGARSSQAPSRNRIVIDSLMPADILRLSVGRASRHPLGRRSRRRNREERHDARLHQRALAGRVLVSRAARASARLGGRHRAASRLARHRRAPLGRRRLAQRHAQSRGVHVEPRPRRRFLARRSRDPDRQPEKRRAAAAARGALGPSAGPAEPHHLRADARARARRSGGRARRGARARDRSAHAAARAARRAHPARRHDRGRRRLSTPTRCSTKCAARTRIATSREANGTGCSTSRAAAACSRRIPSTSASRATRTASTASPNATPRAAPLRADRHHRLRRVGERAVHARRRGSAASRRAFSRSSSRATRFMIGGKAVEFVRMRDMTAWVRRAGDAARRSCRAGWAASSRCRARCRGASSDELERAATASAIARSAARSCR